MSLETKIRFTYKNNKFVELKSITSNLTGLTFGFNWRQLEYNHAFYNDHKILKWSMDGTLSLSIGPGGRGTISESSRSFEGEISITNMSGGAPDEQITGVHHY